MTMAIGHEYGHWANRVTLVTNAIGLAEGHWSHEGHGKRSEKHEDWHWLVLGGLRVVGVEIALPSLNLYMF